MGFTDILEKFGISYESEEAYELADVITEHISYAAIEASIELAKERGAYPNFEGSRWSQGLVPYDSIDLAQEDRQVPIEVKRGSSLDWDTLREKVKEHGIRNATLMAIAPTASIGLVAGTTPGLDPQFAQIFSRATSSGKFLEVNANLVNDLRKLGLWETLREDILRNQGNIQDMEEIPEEIRAVYKTSFQLSPFAFLQVASRAQKWVDQAISRNMYLETRDIDDMISIYSGAWKLGVKTTYYLHMKPRHTAEQSTVKVNKAEQISTNDSAGAPKKGFGFAAAKN
jgi:ribonucleoside-diphosphate reductase alpha chain